MHKVTFSDNLSSSMALNNPIGTHMLHFCIFISSRAMSSPEGSQSPRQCGHDPPAPSRPAGPAAAAHTSVAIALALYLPRSVLPPIPFPGPPSPAAKFGAVALLPPWPP